MIDPCLFFHSGIDRLKFGGNINTEWCFCVSIGQKNATFIYSPKVDLFYLIVILWMYVSCEHNKDLLACYTICFRIVICNYGFFPPAPILYELYAWF